MADFISTTHTDIPDFVPGLLQRFCELTGRINTTCADYALASEWESTGIPLTVAIRGIERKLGRAVGKNYLRTMPLSWCEGDVIDEFTNWRRAVGPHAVRALQTRSDRLVS